jgi:phage terminase Nu1 subunit (DNA packaging protein)
MQRTLPSTRFASTKREAATWLGVSVVSLDAWLAKGCPTLEGRGPRKEIGFDLMEVCRWRFGAPTTSSEGDKLDPAQEKARLDRLRADQIADAIAVKRRELIPAEQFREGLARPFKLLAQTVESLPDVLERDAGLTGAQAELCIRICDRLREDLYQQLIADHEATE